MDKNDAIPRHNRGRRAFWLDLGVLGLAALVLIALRRHAFDLPLERDEGNYAYIATRLLAGDRLYVDVWDHQPFGIFALFAGVTGLFGDDAAVYRWTAMVFSLATLGLVFAILRMAAGSFAAGLGAFLFALVSSDPGTAGEGCNREIYMNTFILAAWALALWGCTDPDAAPQTRIDKRRRRIALCMAGVALALGSAMKTIVAAHWLALAGWSAIAAARGSPKEERIWSVASSLAWIGLGPAILWVGTFAYFAWTGRFEGTVNAVFRFNLSYFDRSGESVARFVEFFAPKRAPFVFESALPLWWAALAAVAWLSCECARYRNLKAAGILLLILAGYVAICLPGQFWPHYYYLLVPPAVIAVAWAMARLTRTAQSRPIDEAERRSGGMLVRRGFVFVTAFAALAAWEYRHYLKQPLPEITAKRYHGRDFWAREQGENVWRVTDPADDIFVYGNDASIYYYARRRCASRFTMITALHSRFPGFEHRRRIMLQEIERRKPRLILVLLGEETFPEWAQGFLPRHYDPAGWDFRDEPPHDPVLMVLADRNRPIESIEWDVNIAQLKTGRD